MIFSVPSFRSPQRVIVRGLSCFNSKGFLVHYAVYLDEFGHIGPYISNTHHKYNDSPVFGLAGMLLPVGQVREFAIEFYQLKCQLLAWDLKNNNPSNLQSYQWEKKGSQLYTVRNVTAYRNLRSATNRILNRITKVGGYVYYSGTHKTVSPDDHNASELFSRQLIQTIRKIDQFCVATNSTFSVLLDEQKAGNRWRERNVEACTMAMFEDKTEKCRTLIEPPLQGESHLFQTLQCADWICGLIGRIAAYSVAATEYPDWIVFQTYFMERINRAALICSGIEQQSTLPAGDTD